MSTALNSALKEQPAVGDGFQHDHEHAAHLRVLDHDRGVVAPAEGAQPRRKIAVCGFASSSRHLMPVNDPTWEIWGMNQLYRHIPRADRWFDIHWNWDTEVVPGTDYRGWLATCGIPFYMMKRDPNIPTAVTYPVDRMIEMAGDYFTSTVAFMVALAIHEIDLQVEAELAVLGDEAEKAGRKLSPLEVMQLATDAYGRRTIGLFGIDLVVDEEYAWQKPCAEFWVGLAVGRGIEVYIPPQSAVCKQQFRYGYEKEPDTVIRLSEVEGHHKTLMEKREAILKELYMYDGALQADEYWKRLIELRLRGAEVRI
jgi:hypothetical protein